MASNKGPSRFAELDAWDPRSKYRSEEKPGNVSWLGPAPPPIHTNTRTPPPRPLEEIFGSILKQAWQYAEANTSRPQGNFLAQGRQAQAARAGTPLPAPYARQAAPTVVDPRLPPMPKLPARPPLPPAPAARAPQPGVPFRPLAGGRMPPLPMPPLPAVPPPPAAPAAPVAPGTPGMPHLQGLVRDWDLHQGLERFVGYAFRGDGRAPDLIKAAGGFLPSSTRDDDKFISGPVYEQFCSYMHRAFKRDLRLSVNPQQFLDIVRKVATTEADRDFFSFYTNWRALAKKEELHLGRMVAQETLKAYISTTRAVTVAKGFARSGGWVYCVAVNGGFIVPDRNATYWTQHFGEAEIAVPRGIGWHSVAAARQLDARGMFTGDVYLRQNLRKIDPVAFETIHKLMSGKKQA